MEEREYQDNITPVTRSKQKEKKKRKPFSRVWVALIPLLILAALAGVHFFGGGLPFPAPEQGLEAAAETPPRYMFALKEFQVNLADEGARRFLRMHIYLGFNDRPLEKEIEERQPELRSLIITFMRSKTVADLDEPGGMEALQQELITMLNEVLQNGRITSLYFVEFIIQ
ncbi:MAG: flagellar basal body-associated FliL family protein [Bacillota bacterium]